MKKIIFAGLVFIISSSSLAFAGTCAGVGKKSIIVKVSEGTKSLSNVSVNINGPNGCSYSDITNSVGVVKVKNVADGGYTITPQLNTCSFSPSQANITVSSKKNTQSKFQANCSGGGSNSVYDKNKRLLGSWLYEYVIISTFQDQYKFVTVFEGDTDDNPYFVGGYDQYGNSDVVGSYSTKYAVWMVLDVGISFSKMYVFDFDSDSRVSGCFFMVYNDGSDRISSCYPMTGTLLSKSFQKEDGLNQEPTDEIENHRQISEDQNLDGFRSIQDESDKDKVRDFYQHMVNRKIGMEVK